MPIRRVLLASLLALAAPTWAFKMSGAGENTATVQSAFQGAYYVRSVPTSDFDESGTTEVFRVGATGDELLDSYPTYMRGTLLLGWSPSAGKWAVVQIEPARITSNQDYAKVGRLDSLRFYLGGQHVRTYDQAALAALGLERQVAHLDNHLPGDFVSRGIEQLPGTNDYRLHLRVNDAAGKATSLYVDVVSGAVVP